MRARNIKPGFFANPDLADCSPWARLCFIGLWTLADRAGRLKDRPKYIKGELFRFDNVDVDLLLDELQAHDFVLRYRNDDGAFIQILAFSKHQSPHYSEKPSTIKPPPLPESDPNQEVQFPDDSEKKSSMMDTPLPESSGALPESSGEDSECSGNLLDRNPLNPEFGFLNPEEDSPPVASSGGPTPPRKVSKAHPPNPPNPPNPLPAFDGNNAAALNGHAIVPIATTFELPDTWGTDAEALGWQAAQVLREAEKFRQYWTVGNGAGKRRSVRGWRQTWSNWLAKAEKEQRR